MKNTAINSLTNNAILVRATINLICFLLFSLLLDVSFKLSNIIFCQLFKFKQLANLLIFFKFTNELMLVIICRFTAKFSSLELLNLFLNKLQPITYASFLISWLIMVLVKISQINQISKYVKICSFYINLRALKNKNI